MSQDSVRDCPPELLRSQNDWLLGELKWQARELDKARAELGAAREQIRVLREALQDAGRLWNLGCDLTRAELVDNWMEAERLQGRADDVRAGIRAALSTPTDGSAG